MLFTSYSYNQVRFNDHKNLSLTVSYTQNHRFLSFLIIIAHYSKEYCFLDGSHSTVLRIQVMVYVSYVVIC